MGYLPNAPERRNVDVYDGQPIIQILPKLTGTHQLSQVTVRGANDPDVDGTHVHAPTGRSCASCNADSNLTCMAAGRRPISSSNNVPPLAASNAPQRFRAAPLESPYS